jgi:hypothetical protein
MASSHGRVRATVSAGKPEVRIFLSYSHLDHAALALQLQWQARLYVSSSSFGLMGSSPQRPGDDVGGFDLLLSQPIGDAPDFLDRPADQLF